MRDSNHSTSDQAIRPEIEIAPIEKLTMYMVLDTELKTLERGPRSSIYLNFALPLLSIAITFIVALLITEIPNPKTYVCFVVLASVFSVLGLLLMFLWRRDLRSTSDTVKAIRGRLPSKAKALPIAAQAVRDDASLALELVTAHYGSQERMIDVTEQLKAKVKNGKLTVRASNDIAGDPHHLVKKSLHIVYLREGKLFRATIGEGRTLTLPE